MVDEDDEEITTIHAGELVLSRAGTSPVRLGPQGPSRPEGTVRLGAPHKAEPREETVLLQGDAPGPDARPLRPSDSGWGTVVLPGGGHPAHVADRTQLLAVDDPEDAAAITATRLSSGAPDPIDAVDTTTLPGIGRASPAEPSPASTSPFRGLGPGAWTIPRIGLASPPTASAAAPTSGHATVPMASGAARSVAAPTGGHAVVPVASHPPAAPPTDGHPVVPISGGHPVVISGGHPMVISGGHPVVPLTPTGGSPIIPRSSARARGRAPARSAAPTGAHAGLRPAASDDARLAWGFLLGVLITVAIVGMAVALALYLLR